MRITGYRSRRRHDDSAVPPTCVRQPAGRSVAARGLPGLQRSFGPSCYDPGVELDTSRWSGDGAFTQLLVDALGAMEPVQRVRVEDAPASRADAGFSFISNEIYVTFRRHGLLRGRRPRMTLSGL